MWIIFEEFGGLVVQVFVFLDCIDLLVRMIYRVIFLDIIIFDFYLKVIVIIYYKE